MSQNPYSHITASAQAIAKGYHNGIAGLALAMHKNPTIFANKLNPNCDTNQLTLEEAAEITDRTQNPAIADALAALVGRVTVALPCGQPSLRELSRDFCHLAKECGDVGQQINESEHPESEWGEQLSPSERKRIAKELRDLLSVTAGLLQQVEG
ncbi:phage regulatory CII family protein [Vogesella sp. EB]|uniref:phage regulatory CII family protein n=1 Tax=Vogesella sp. EB TaxID=1526735 RepID=UPI00069FBF09|nr:phage regulatory CII family protein [Vogesella sp. EB]